MDLGIRHRVAFVSGGSKGMGLSVARMLADEGCKVAVVARSQGPVDAAVEAITAGGGIAMGVTADLTTREGVAKAVAVVAARFGAPDIAISNVQDNIAGNFDDVSDDDFRHFFNTHAMSVVYLAREVLPAMKSRGWGRLVAIGSGAAKEPEGMIRHILANTARPAAVGLLKTLSDEVARHGVTVNSVGPGWIGTDNMFAYLEQKMAVKRGDVDAFLGGAIPAGRVGKPDEIASLIVYLCSNLAGYITGEWIAVDGGKHRFAF
jgi:3-oxoacyl-[acyl-carrier protein] reductase